MLILYLILLFFIYKYVPIIKNKINSEYQKKFNIIIFSKENSKKPFISSILILFGKIYMDFSQRDKISGIILMAIGVAIMVYVIYDTYKKTDFLYGTIAGGFYLLILGLQLLLGIMMIGLVMGVFIMLCANNSNQNYPYD